jgi:WD40 repeat protein
VELRGHAGSVVGLAFAPGGGALATAGADGAVRLWDAATGRERAVLRGPGLLALAVAFAPDGRSLAAGGVAQEVWMWDVAGLSGP